ncbi:hypothetical protein [Candidatus Pantoea bituminis]|uniref:hypothetical protein n=1 Tax=Candidatus Pantoea bituminis TaxID=2831036 RepID=UPI001C060C34|nr:hypothetical protein [Pantoea bituminis]
MADLRLTTTAADAKKQKPRSLAGLYHQALPLLCGISSRLLTFNFFQAIERCF